LKEGWIDKPISSTSQKGGEKTPESFVSLREVKRLMQLCVCKRTKKGEGLKTKVGGGNGRGPVKQESGNV